MEGVADPKRPPLPHMYYLVKFGIYINRTNPQNWGALGHRPLSVAAWLTPGNTLLTTS